MKQTSFAQAEFAAKKKITRRQRFLAEMEQAVPWPMRHWKMPFMTARPYVTLSVSTWLWNRFRTLTTLLKFRHLLEKQALTQVIFEQINGHLAERGMLMREGTIVDATIIIAAPPSTKNRAKARDPEMHQAKKGNEWYEGSHWYGCRLRPGSQSDGYGCQRGRYHRVRTPVAW
jgi:IS5 family transposase